MANYHTCEWVGMEKKDPKDEYSWDWVMCDQPATEYHPDRDLDVDPFPRFCRAHVNNGSFSSMGAKPPRAKRAGGNRAGYKNLPTTDHTPATTSRLSPEECIVRNLRIVALRQAGMTYYEIACEVGLSCGYVHTLYKRLSRPIAA